MEIHRLHLTLTEQDLNDLAREHLLDDVPVEDLQFRIKADGIRVTGVYQVFMPVSFEALWQLGVDQGRPTARLSSFKTMGMPANVLKSLIMNVIADAAKKEHWLDVQGDLVRLDLDLLLKKKGLQAQTRLTAIRCQANMILIEAGH